MTKEKISLMTLVQNITTISAFLDTYFRELNILSVFWRKFESFSHTLNHYVCQNCNFESDTTAKFFSSISTFKFFFPHTICQNEKMISKYKCGMKTLKCFLLDHGIFISF